MPIATVVLGSNTDATPVVTKQQACMYCCKYCSKHSKRKGQASVLYEVVDDMEKKDANAGWSKRELSMLMVNPWGSPATIL